MANTKITSRVIADNAVTSSAIADGAITASKIASDAIDVVADTSPQLGGDLDVNGNAITGSTVQINGAGGELMISATENGPVALRYDNNLKLTTKSDGVDITGELQSDSLDVDGDADISGTIALGNLTIAGAQGTDGQVLTSTGSGIAWEDAAGGGVAGIVSSADATAITIDSSERVGIGVNSMTQKLVVGGEANTRLQIDGSATSGVYFTVGGSNGGTIRSGATNQLEFFTTSEAMRIASNGDVQLQGGNQMTNALSWWNSATYELASIENVSHPSYNDSGGLVFKTAGLSNSGMAERMRIDSSGRVGIGTNDPSSGYGGTITAAKLALLSGTAGSDGGSSTLLIGGDNKHYAYMQGRHTTGGATELDLGTASGASNPTVKVRIKPNGELMVGTTNLFGGGNKTTAFFGAKSDANLRLLSANNGGYACLVIHNTGLNTVGSITQNGSNASFNTSSDYRLKENVDYAWDAKTRFKQLKPARFNWIRDETNTLQDGFLAHEVEDIVPEAVKGTKDEVKDTISNVVLNASSVKIDENITEQEWIAGKEDGTYEADTTWVASYAEPIYQQIDHSKLVPLLVKTIQELEARITTLENS